MNRESRMVPRTDIVPKKYSREKLRQNVRNLQSISLNVNEKKEGVKWKDIITIYEDCSVFMTCAEITEFTVEKFDGITLQIAFNFFNSSISEDFQSKQD